MKNIFFKKAISGQKRILPMIAAFTMLIMLAGSNLYAASLAQSGSNEVASTSEPSDISPKIDPEVYEALEQFGEAEVFIMLDESDTGDGGKNETIEKRKDRVAALQNSLLADLPNSGRRSAAQADKLFEITAAMIINVSSTEMLDMLANHPNVRKVDLENSGGTGGLVDSVPLVGGDVSYNNGFTGEGVTVAVMDSGFDTDHPALANALVAEACFQTAQTTICDNGTTGTGSAEDDHWHGTFVSGIITSNGQDGVGRGMAPDSKIAAIKVLDSGLSFQSSSQIVDAWDYIYENLPDVKVINLSLGTGERFPGVCDNDRSWTQALAASAKRLRDRGTLIIAITHNDSDYSDISAPGCISHVMAVGATNQDDSYASYSNSNSVTDLLAPGTNIDSANLGGGVRTNFFGTSYSVPHVAGCAALLIESGITDVAALENRLRQSPVQVTAPNGLTFPRLDCAIDSISQPQPTPTPVPPTAVPTPTFEGTNLALNGAVSQSSTSYNGEPGRAIDDNTSGVYRDGSVTHTAGGTAAEPAWWEIDLGAVSDIDSVVLWSRTDSCCTARLSDVHIFVSDVPFAGATLASSQSLAGVSEYFIGGELEAQTTTAVGRSGRYVRVQLSDEEPLSLAEVQILDIVPAETPVPPTNTPTHTPIPPTVTAIPPTATPMPTSTPVSTPASTDAFIEASTHSVVEGEEFVVRLDGYNLERLGTATIEVIYDPTVLEPLGCNKDPNDLFNLVQCNLNFGLDRAQFNITSLTGVSGDVAVAELTFQAIGQDGDQSDIALAFPTIADNRGNTLTIDTIEGLVSISNVSIGDVNCDGTRNAVDVLYILQYDVGLREASTTCDDTSMMYKPSCDVSRDGECNSIDALLSLRCDVGMANVSCPNIMR